MDEKPLEASAQKIQHALEEGKTGFSAELTAALAFFTGLLFLWLAGPQFYASLVGAIESGLLGCAGQLGDVHAIVPAALNALLPATQILAACLLVTMLVPGLSGALQNRFNVTFKPLAFKPERLNPVEGFKRLFSTRSLVRLITSLFRAAIVLLVAWWLFRSRLDAVLQAGDGGFLAAFSLACDLLLKIGLATAALIVVIGVADLGWQKWKNLQDLRMTVQEFREELKRDDGDPLIKSRMRKVQAERMKKSLAREIPRATVIITNPTHFAVALRYERSESDAPVVIAKGADLIAKRIIELAGEHGVPVVERKPVARFLYYRARLGQSIPMEMYQAVAEIISFVTRKRAA
jgi:flagellar biosynthesis protein FlhB